MSITDIFTVSSQLNIYNLTEFRSDACLSHLVKLNPSLTERQMTTEQRLVQTTNFPPTPVVSFIPLGVIKQFHFITYQKRQFHFPDGFMSGMSHQISRVWKGSPLTKTFPSMLG